MTTNMIKKNLLGSEGLKALLVIKSPLVRVCMIVALSPILFLSLMSCSEETPEDDPSKNTTDVAVTGKVGKYGCTYAEISGYANIDRLPIGSGNPVLGVELSYSDSIDENSSMHRAESNILIGNIFTVAFNQLAPSSSYRYRTFVAYDGQTYYGEHSEFTTAEVANIATTGDATDITRNSAIIISAVQTEEIDSLDEYFVGIAYAVNKSSLHPDSAAECYRLPIADVVDGVLTVRLERLHDATTYYYAAFAEVDGGRSMSAVKEFTTEPLVHKVAEAVDLGLSVKWASWNIGANAPEEYGCYYAWGEVEEKADYSLDTYSFYHNGSYVDVGTDICGTEYDVAHIKWGGNWRMPTKEEIDELCYECTWRLTSISLNEEVYGSIGYTITGPNGNTIFLPAAGSRYGKESSQRKGHYWAGTLEDNEEGLAFEIYFNSGMRFWDTNDRYRGCTIRPVIEY